MRIEWKRIAENLVRHPGGTIYLSAKVRGSKVRKSLDTEDLRTAKRKRDLELDKLRGAVTHPDDIRSLRDALSVEKARTLAKPKLKAKTIRYYEFLFSKIAQTLPLRLTPDEWDADAARTWWKAHSEAVTPIHANTALRVVRRLSMTLVERGLRRDDPTAVLKRVRQPQTRIDDLPTTKQMEGIIQDIRAQALHHSEEAADMVEFLAWTGLRISEARALRWEDVDEQWITVTGGEAGTKNHEIRQVPLNVRSRALLGSRRYEEASGPIFLILTPRLALAGACKRLGIRHMRVHDLRHWFTTHCLERGIDVVTVANWLGHKDGGKTLLATYAHHQKQHSLASAAKLE